MISRGFHCLGRYFLTGLLAILPLALTLAIAAWAVTFASQIVGPNTFLGKILQRIAPDVSNDTLAYIIGWLFVLAAIFLFGILLENGMKKFFQTRFDALVKRVPIVGTVYDTSKQLVDMLDTKSESEMKKMSVVFCFFGRETGAAFLALMPTPERFHIGGVDYHAIIIPSAPVPFGGSMLFVPAAQVEPAGINVDAFMSLYVSMGVTGSQFLPVRLPDEPEA